MEELRRRRFVSKLERPYIFALLVVAHLFLACAGFAPAVAVFLRKGRWWLNPVKQPAEWANDNHPTMKLHALVSLSWVLLALVQFLVTPLAMLHTRYTAMAKAIHRPVGYAAVFLLLVFAANANYLAIVNGVAGKIHYNLLAIITSVMMMWHLYWAVYTIRNNNRYGHIREMCGLLSWTCFPGAIRALHILPQQYFFLPEDCDVMNTSGPMAFTFPFCIAGLWALRWAAIGEKFQYADYAFFYILIVADVFLGIIDGTLLQCNPDGGLLEQIPGKAWTLKNW